jgi:hypothetical protein
MKAGREEITVLGLGPPQINALETGTLAISAYEQGAPTTTQGASTAEAAGTTAPPPKLRLFPKKMKPFNYAKTNPLLHTLGCVEHTSDDALTGNERTGDKSDKDTPVETDRMSSEDSDLAEQMDLLLNGGVPLSRTQSNNDNDLFDDGSTLVDYESEGSGDNRASDNDGFAVDLSQHPDYLEQDEASGNEQSTTLGTGDNRQQEIRHENVTDEEMRHENVMNEEIIHENIMNEEIRHENVMNAKDKPVLTQQAIMEIIKRQTQAVMQKVGWEQKKQTYRDLLSGYESPNGT